MIKTEEKIKEKFFLFIIFILIFYIYLVSLFPTYKNNDSPEIAAASYTLGICHPPGYPFYINFSKVFSLIPIGNVSFRLNIFSSFLAILTLLCTYFILKNISNILFKKENKIYCILSIFLLAFSYIFWNQAIEVKGGIYHLNLLFLSLIILFFIKLIINFKLSYLYILVYLYALSLTNHWQSMIILLPWIIFIIWYCRHKINFATIFLFIIFFTIGLSCYIYLWVRETFSPIICWGDTSNALGFFEFIIRKPYFAEAIKFTTNNLIRNIKTFIELFLMNYWFLWIFSIPGFYFLFKNNKIIFFSFLYIIFIIFFTVIFYYARNILEVTWLLKIFFMPFEYIVLILISLGIFFILFKYNKIFLFLIFILLIPFYIKTNIKGNYRTQDFFSYDMAFNLFNTINNDSYYFTEHDMYFFPVLYEQTINKKRADIKLIPISFLQYKWFSTKMEEKYGYVNISSKNILNNYYEFINQTLKLKKIIYRDFSSDLFDKILKYRYNSFYAGILKVISENNQSESPLIYDLYSLRGIFSLSAQTEENIEIVMRYLIFSSMHAEKLMNAGRFNEAIKLFKFALKMPVEKFEYKIYYNLALCYDGINDDENKIYYLKKSIQAKIDFFPAHEQLALYYIKKGYKKEAQIFLENAIKYGSTNKKIIDLYNSF